MDHPPVARKLFPLKDDHDLWARLREGDRDAFGEIYDRYFPLLFRYCIRFTPNRSLVKDVLQDFFTHLYLKHQSLPPVEKPKSYLLVAARRKLIRYLGKEQRQSHQQVNEEQYVFSLELSVENAIIDRQHAERKARYLQLIIDKLTPRQKEAVYLRFYENLAYEEIAEILSLKEVKYARTLIYRAIAELKQALLQDGRLLSHS